MISSVQNLSQVVRFADIVGPKVASTSCHIRISSVRMNNPLSGSSSVHLRTRVVVVTLPIHGVLTDSKFVVRWW